ncbi:hypothetical protein TKK_0000661 [Trichogramma kaykai]|uniref:Carboxypeptidase Q n=1 Tax=Trichogramma kaykai TaxID=54128 RepID=A0ABD2VZT1_9HYME
MKIFRRIRLLALLIVVLIGGCGCSKRANKHDKKCQLPDDLAEEIESYAPVVRVIVNEAVNGSFRGVVWRELADFVDKFGSRLAGTRNLEDAIDHVLARSKEKKLDNVHGEVVKVPHWIRGKESATLWKPRKKDLAMLGLGYSVGTPPEGIRAKAIVVKSFAELQKRANEVPGRIVVYNQKFVSYGKTVQYRSRGASEAAKLGAVAALVRSVTPVSIYSPHTGMMEYEEGWRKIPAACITLEDAAMLQRMADRGDELEISLRMEARLFPDLESRNVVAEVLGSDEPDKAVVVSGHVDSWDVGQGAMDDGGGAFISWGAAVLLRSLGLKPRRTVRSIMWTAEEFGMIGASQYVQAHKANESNLQLVMESDIGTFNPLGLEVTGTSIVKCVLEKILDLVPGIGPLDIRTPQAGPDIEEWVNSGVPGASLWNQNDRYFWYHHTRADTMSLESPQALDRGTALFAAVAYVAADLSLDLPRHAPIKTGKGNYLKNY